MAVSLLNKGKVRLGGYAVRINRVLQCNINVVLENMFVRKSQ